MTTTYHQGDCSLFAKHTLGMRPFESGYGCMAGHQSYQVLRWLEQRKRFQLMEGGGGLQADTTGNQAGIPRTWESVTQCSGAMIVRAQQGPFAWVGALPSTHHQQFRIVAKPREGLPCGEQSP